MRITIAGAGYVGLVAGACYASSGNSVTMADANDAHIAKLEDGELPIYEPGLLEMVRDNVAAGRLRFTTDFAGSIAGAEMIGVAVGTPPQDDGSVDMQYIDAVARTIGENLTDYAIVVTKSTVPVGTHKRVSDIIRGLTDAPFDYVSNPEFLKEGSAVDDFLKPERVIVGADSDRARRALGHLYAPFMRRGRKILFMDPASAELTKYACNSMLATRISFMNELSRLAEAVGADINHVRWGMGSDSRIGRSFLYPGLGYGGSCFPKDVQALVRTGDEHGLDMSIVRSAHQANADQVQFFLDKIGRRFDADLAGKKAAVWGLSFKPQTDDMRDAPSIPVIRRMLDWGARVTAFDPQAADRARQILGDSIEYADGMYEALEDADLLVICTEWMQFRSPDFGEVSRRMNAPVIFDGRNLYDPSYAADAGLDYNCIGRPSGATDPV